jgi:hypothetical protein
VSDDYDDGTISCAADGLRIRRYYMPFGSKRIPCSAIRAVERVPIGALTGRGRIWGTAHPGHWANLDPRRPRKKVGFVIDAGAHIKPFLTPSDPAAFEAAIAARTTVPVTSRRGRLFI